MKLARNFFLLLTLAWGSRHLCATTFEVGVAKQFTALGQVPWGKLQPGDTVLIHARPEPYREKFVLCCAGTAAQPITVRGVPDAAGQLPVITGDGATTAPNLIYWGEARSVIKVGGAQNPADTMPRYLVLENLEVRSARPPYKFTGADGREQAYAKNAAAIHVEKAEHLIIRHCTLHDAGNGLFVSSNDQRASRDILVERNYIFGNGNPNSGQEHNVYSAAVGIVFQYNRFGPLRATCLGGNLKDRSAGLVIRANWIEGGNKELDLVDAEDSVLIRRDPTYREAWVLGNVFLKLPADKHPILVHCGGDSPATENYRRGVLHFYNNTIVSYRADPTFLFWLSSNDERCDFRNNVVFTAHAKGKIIFTQTTGTVALSHNWLPSGWQPCAAAPKTPTAKLVAVIQDDGTSLTGASPGFVDLAGQDFRLTARSPCRGAGEFWPSREEPREYVRHQAGKKREFAGRPAVGAFEFTDK